MQRIVVVGPTCSGKTSMARELGRRLELPHTELDALHWDPNWTEAPDEVFRERAARAVAGESWIVDGNYGAVRDLVWGRAELVVWLDYSLPLVLWRLSRRTLGRLVRRETLWNGNRESWQTHFLTRDSLFLWLLKSYKSVRQRMLRLRAQPEYAHLEFVRLRSPRAAREWLARMPGWRPGSGDRNPDCMRLAVV